MAYQEYPKWVADRHGKKVIVRSVEEEAKVTATIDQPEPVQPRNELQECAKTDERALLILQAKDKGVKIDKRWGVEKLRAALEA